MNTINSKFSSRTFILFKNHQHYYKLCLSVWFVILDLPLPVIDYHYTGLSLTITKHHKPFLHMIKYIITHCKQLLRTKKHQLDPII